MYVIAGVTGHTGKTVADTLLAQGQPVRVLVRKPEQGAAWKARGAEVAIGSLDDEAALVQAFTGAKGAYLLSPPDLTTNDYFGISARRFDTIARAIGKSKLPHVVLLSSIAAQVPKGTGPIAGLAAGEKVLERTGAATTHVRASYFLANYGAVLPAAKADGVLPSFLPADFSHSVVTTDDIGRTAAQALLDGPRGRRVIELSGPDVTPTEIAAAVGQLLGRPVKVAEAPLDAVVPTFKSFGASQQMAELYREMYAGFIDGTIQWEGQGERVRGATGLADGLRALV